MMFELLSWMSLMLMGIVDDASLLSISEGSLSLGPHS